MKPGEVAEALGIPASTIRRYVLDYKEFFSPSARKSKQREYLDSDVATLAQIRQLVGQGIRPNEIRNQLNATIDEQPPVTETAITLSGIMTKLHDQAAQIQDQADQLTQLQEQLSQVQAELDRLKTPWYKRIFRPPTE